MVDVHVLLAEDSGLLRESLGRLLRHFGHAVTAVPDATAMVTVAMRLEPDLVVSDVRMPPTFTSEGLEAAIALRARRAAQPVLVLSQYVHTGYVAELLSTGNAGTGYLLKDRVADGTKFVEVMREVAAGGTVIDQEVVRRLLDRRRDPLTRLTERELEVLGLMAQGRSNAAIAQTLVVTEATVTKHIGSIFAKLDLHTDENDHRRVLAVLTFLRGGR